MNSPIGTKMRRAALCLLGLVASSASSTWADGVIRDGLGAISSGRGGTNIAHSDNGEILMDNPAAMVNVQGCGLFELSLDMLITDLHYTDPDNSVDAAVNPFPLGQLSLIKKSPNGLWAYGLGVFAPAGFSAKWDMTAPPPIGGTQRYKSLGAQARILPGVAVQLTDRLSLGGTLGVAVSHVELEAPFFIQTGPFLGTPTLLDLQATGAALAWSIGLQYELSECTTLGFTYLNETRFQLEGNARVDASAIGLGQSGFDAEVGIVWPRSVGLGLKHSTCEHRRFSADVIWFDWSHAFDRLEMQLTDATNAGFTALLGPLIYDTFPLEWHDSVSMRLGHEYFVTPCCVLRAGYAYHPNQIPESTLTPYIPAILEHAFSVGFGRAWHNNSFDLAYQFSYGRNRRVNTSAVVGGDFNFSKVEAQAHWLFMSFLRRF